MLDMASVFHIGYAVKNMKRSVKTWEKSGAELVVAPAIDPIQNVECCLFIWQGAAAIELVAPLSGVASPIDNRLSKGGGLDHICLFTDDMESDIAATLAEGSVLVVPSCYCLLYTSDAADE